MDDFGSGYSSLNTLAKLHIDELKLDRGFLLESSSGKSDRSRIIMEQIVQLSKRLGIDVYKRQPLSGFASRSSAVAACT